MWELNGGGRSCVTERGTVVYQDPVPLVFGQHNGRYPSYDSLRDTRCHRFSNHRQIIHYMIHDAILPFTMVQVID